MSMKKITGALLVAAGITLSAVPAAQAFPEKDITFIIPYNTGGGFDRTVRLIAPFLEKHLPGDVNVLPKNIPGAAGRKGAATMYRAKPDGYTISIMNMPGFAIPQMVGEDVAYDLNKVTWIGTASSSGYTLGVAGKSPARSVDDLKKMGTVKMTVTGKGSTAYIASVISTQVLGINAEFVTGYKGSKNYILGLVRGDGDASVMPTSTVRKYIESGDVRPLMTMSEEPIHDGVPNGAALGHPELDTLGVVRMVAAPPGVPADVTKILSDALLAALADPELQAAAAKAKLPLTPRGSEDTQAAYQAMNAFYMKFKDHLGK